MLKVIKNFNIQKRSKFLKQLKKVKWSEFTKNQNGAVNVSN